MSTFKANLYLAHALRIAVHLYICVLLLVLLYNNTSKTLAGSGL